MLDSLESHARSRWHREHASTSCFKKTSITNHSSVSRPPSFQRLRRASDKNSLGHTRPDRNRGTRKWHRVMGERRKSLSLGSHNCSSTASVPATKVPHAGIPLARPYLRLPPCVDYSPPLYERVVGRSIVVTLAALRVAVNPLDSEEFDSESIERFVSMNADLVS